MDCKHQKRKDQQMSKHDTFSELGAKCLTAASMFRKEQAVSSPAEYRNNWTLLTADKALAPLGEWLDIPTAAAIAKMPVRTLRKWIRQGRVQAYGRPRMVRVRMSDVLPAYTPPECRKKPLKAGR
jgi:hypothetical protein